MAIYNAGKAKSILDQVNQGILGDDSAQASQPAYQNAYQAVMGQTPDIAGTPDWYQRQRLAFYKPTDIDTNAVDLFTSTSAQAEDWRKQGAEGYQQFAKQYGTDTPWLFRAQSEGGLGYDPTKFNLIADPTKRFDFKGDVGSNAYMNALYGGDPGIQSSYLEAQFNPLTGKQEGAFDLFHTYRPGPAEDKGRKGFGMMMDSLFGNQASSLAKSGLFGSGIARTVENAERSSPINQTKERAYDKLYGYVPQGGQRQFANVAQNQQNLQGAAQNMSGAAPERLQSYAPIRLGYGAYQQTNPFRSQYSQFTQDTRNNMLGGAQYATRFQNPYRRNPYEY